jgi:hypothetical protein
MAREWSAHNRVAVGPDTGKIILKLAPEAIVTGRVTGQDDEPLEGAFVQVLAYTSHSDGPQQLLPVSGTRSDEDGYFRVAGLPSGRYYVTVRSAGISRNVLGTQTAQASQAYPPLSYYPGTEDLAAASMIDLAPGQRFEALFSLALRPAYKVSGTVVTAGEWKQVHPPTIVDGTGQSLVPVDMFDAKTGAFEYRAVPAGTYSVRLGGTDPQDRHRSSDHKITISKTVSGLRLLLKPGIDIPVVIRTEFTKPKPVMHATCSQALPSGGFQQSDCSDYPAARIELIAADATGLRFSTDYGPVKGSEGIVVHGVAPGRYLVRANATFMPGGYVQSLRSGSQDLLLEPLKVEEGGSVMPIEVVVRDDSATLKVTLHAEKPGQSATVLLYAEGALLLSPNLRGSTNSTEMYFAQLAPGSYKVFAFDSIDGVDYARPEGLAMYAPQAARVTVSANGTSSVMVDVIRTGD